MLTGVPLDCAGADDGACRLPELLELLEELEEPDELELLDEPESFGEFPSSEELDRADDECELPEDFAGDDVPVPDDPVLAEACVDPGSIAMTTPAATMLAVEMATVADFSRWRPRSRSAAARETADMPLRNCGVLMPEVCPANL